LRTVGSTSLTTCSSSGVPTLLGGATQGTCYDQADRLVGYKQGTTTSSYAYDGDGLRTSKTVGSATTSYVWDVSQSPPLVVAFTTGAGTTKADFGLGTLATAVDPAATVFVAHTDGLGSVRALSGGASSSVAQTY